MNHLMAASHWSMASNTGLWLAACPGHHVITPRVLTKMVLMDQDGQDTITSHLPGPPSLWFWLIVPNIIPGAQGRGDEIDSFVYWLSWMIRWRSYQPIRGQWGGQWPIRGWHGVRWQPDELWPCLGVSSLSDSAQCEPFVSLGLSSPINIHNHHF